MNHSCINDFSCSDNDSIVSSGTYHPSASKHRVLKSSH